MSALKAKPTHHELTNLPLTANPDTDIWRKPPAHNVFSVRPTYLDIPVFHPTQLSRALITFSGTWVQQFDQAGIVLAITTTAAPDPSAIPPSWIKTGIEFFDGVPYISFVGCDRWADWSITPVRSKSTANGTTSIEITVDEEGTTLWAYEVELDQGTGEVVQRWPVRECTWPLHDAGRKGVRVGAYAARPAKEEAIGEGEDKVLRAHVERLVVDLREG